jgi:hypothetical protein
MRKATSATSFEVLRDIVPVYSESKRQKMTEKWNRQNLPLKKK